VPTDCLALALKEALPDAETLELAFAGGGRFSKGTAKTMLEGLPHVGAVREAGRIRRVPIGWQTTEVPFRDKARFAVTIPWGDIATLHTQAVPSSAAVTTRAPSGMNVAWLTLRVCPRKRRRSRHDSSEARSALLALVDGARAAASRARSRA
jgi:short subunit dehydrogenase-like uncharacterized protein